MKRLTRNLMSKKTTSSGAPMSESKIQVISKGAWSISFSFSCLCWSSKISSIIIVSLVDESRAKERRDLTGVKLLPFDDVCVAFNVSLFVGWLRSSCLFLRLILHCCFRTPNQSLNWSSCSSSGTYDIVDGKWTSFSLIVCCIFIFLSLFHEYDRLHFALDADSHWSKDSYPLESQKSWGTDSGSSRKAMLLLTSGI